MSFSAFVLLFALSNVGGASAALQKQFRAVSVFPASFLEEVENEIGFFKVKHIETRIPQEVFADIPSEVHCAHACLKETADGCGEIDRAVHFSGGGGGSCRVGKVDAGAVEAAVEGSMR